MRHISPGLERRLLDAAEGTGAEGILGTLRQFDSTTNSRSEFQGKVMRIVGEYARDRDAPGSDADALNEQLVELEREFNQ